MDKRDIRKGIKEALVNARDSGYRGEYFDSDDATDALIQKLHSQGVVRKVGDVKAVTIASVKNWTYREI